MIRLEDGFLIACGVMAGAAAGMTWWALRRRCTALTVLCGFALAVVATDLSVESSTAIATCVACVVLVGLAAAMGALLLDRQLPNCRPWLALGALLSSIALWTAVPETSYVLAAGGVLGAIASLALAFGLPLTQAAIAALTLLAALPAIGGASPTFLRVMGAMGCLGLTLWWPLGQGLRLGVERALRRPIGGVQPGWWLLAVHVSVALVAARWIGAARSPSWARLGVVAGVGVVAAALAHRPHQRNGLS